MIDSRCGSVVGVAAPRAHTGAVVAMNVNRTSAVRMALRVSAGVPRHAEMRHVVGETVAHVNVAALPDVLVGWCMACGKYREFPSAEVRPEIEKVRNGCSPSRDRTLRKP